MLGVPTSLPKSILQYAKCVKETFVESLPEHTNNGGLEQIELLSHASTGTSTIERE